jgi:hypothetical protein
MNVKYVSIFLLFFGIIIIVWGIYMIHMYPGKVAKLRKHPQLKAIEVTSVMGLLIFPLWIAALIWAHSNAIIGSLYNKGDATPDEVEQKEPSAPVAEDHPDTKHKPNKK